MPCSAADPGNAVALSGQPPGAWTPGSTALDTELRAQLAPVKDRAFIVFHDAYHYFEARYGLAAAGAVTVSPERPPGARRVAAIKAWLRRRAHRLPVHRTPGPAQARPACWRTERRSRTGQLDPEGASLDPGPGALFPPDARPRAQRFAPMPYAVKRRKDLFKAGSGPWLSWPSI